MTLGPETVGLVAAAVLSPLLCEWVIYPLLGRYFRDDAPPDPHADHDALARTFRLWSVLGVIAFLGFWATATALWALPLRWLRAAHASALASTSLALIIPTEIIIAVPALVVGGVWALLPLPLFYRVLLRDRYPEWLRYQRLEMQKVIGVPIDADRTARTLVTAGSLIALLFVQLGFDCYTRFTREGIVLNRYWGLGESVRPYADVSAVTVRTRLKAPNGDWVHRPHLAVEFKDGAVWRSIDMPWERVDTHDPRLTDEALGRMVAEASGVTFRNELAR